MPLQHALDVEVLRLRRLHVRLVVDGQVVDDVLRGLAVHPPEAVLDDVPDLVGVGRVVGDDRRVGRGVDQRVAVAVLQALAGQRRPPGGRTDQEAAGHLVRRGPDAVGGALEAEHRVEGVDRHHRLAVRGVRRARPP